MDGTASILYRDRDRLENMNMNGFKLQYTGMMNHRARSFSRYLPNALFLLVIVSGGGGGVDEDSTTDGGD